MAFSFRLAELLASLGLNPRGMIKEICDHTGLERHQVSSVLHNKARSISLDVLSKLCRYLEDKKIDPAILPGALFVHEPGNFCALLTERHRIDVCFGVRTGGDVALVMAHDSLLNGTLLQEITGERERSGSRRLTEFHQCHVPAPPKESAKEADFRAGFDVAREHYLEFERHPADRAFVFLGSQKSCSPVEILFANAFGVEPFKRDAAKTPAERKCPFFFFYRSTDASPPSCAGGTRLSIAQKTPEPGLHYELANGKWEWCPCDHENDAALIFYVYDPAMGRVEMALSGFTGRSTVSLGTVIQGREGELWPPQAKVKGKQYGAYIVKFKFQKTEVGETPLPTTIEIVPLAGGVIEGRLARPRAAQENPEASQEKPEASKGKPKASKGKPRAAKGRPKASKGKPKAAKGKPKAAKGKPRAAKGK